jgi:DNA-directed RNA polymerase subunit RPC12/RpoP
MDSEVNPDISESSSPSPIPHSFKCPQCRFLLFPATSLIPHQATVVRKFSGKRQLFSEGTDCTTYFIEKPDWLPALGRRSDSILCPKCGYKVGHFSWVGSQCSCGEWVKPSFQIAKSRVDPSFE